MRTTFEEQDGALETKFRKQIDLDMLKNFTDNRLGEVLAWLVQGVVSWYASKDLNTNVPAVVEKFTTDSFKEIDLVRTFLEEACEVGEDFRVSVVALH